LSILKQLKIKDSIGTIAKKKEHEQMTIGVINWNEATGCVSRLISLNGFYKEKDGRTQPLSVAPVFFQNGIA